MCGLWARTCLYILAERCRRWRAGDHRHTAGALDLEPGGGRNLERIIVV